MVEIREILRLWLAGTGLRVVARLSGIDRKTVRRYVEMAQSHGLDRDGGVSQLTDDVLAAVVGGVRSKRPNGKSQAWELIAANHGVVVSYRTLNRYATAEFRRGVQCGRRSAALRRIW